MKQMLKVETGEAEEARELLQDEPQVRNGAAELVDAESPRSISSLYQRQRYWRRLFASQIRFIDLRDHAEKACPEV